jgi:ABC-type amino acid transport substrate-binding protein
LRTRAALDPGLTVLTVFRREPVAVLLPPNDSAWADLVNISLSNMLLDGSYARLYQQWFGLPPDQSALAPLLGPVDLQLAQLPDALQTDDRLARVLEIKALRVAYASNPPFSRLEENNLPGGFEVELTQALAQRILGSTEGLSYVPINGALAEGVAAADIVIGGFPRTQANELVADFALPTFRTGENTVAIAVPPRQSPLRDAVNLALLQMAADGSYAELYTRWFSGTQPVTFDAWR